MAKLNQHTKAVRFLFSKVKTAINEYGLIKPCDHILIAISGGVDSLLMTEAIYRYKQSAKFEFELSAVHVEAVGVDYNIDKTSLSEFCKTRNIDLHYKSFEFEKNEKTLKSPCFYCSWQRRKIYYSLSEDLACNKLALGHHADDAIETLVLNMLNHKTISSMPASLPMFGDRLLVIRPLITMFKSELNEIAESLEIKSFTAQCSYAKDNNRLKAKQILDEAEKLFPNTRKNIFASMSAVHEKYLPSKENQSPIVFGLNEIHPNEKIDL